MAALPLSSPAVQQILAMPVPMPNGCVDAADIVHLGCRHLKAFIASCGTYSNLVKQAQSKQKVRRHLFVLALLLGLDAPDPLFIIARSSSSSDSVAHAPLRGAAPVSRLPPIV